MDEKRKVTRHRTFKAGSIAFNRAGTIDCRVRNMSPAGACLEHAEVVVRTRIRRIDASCERPQHIAVAFGSEVGGHGTAVRPTAPPSRSRRR